MSLTQIVGLEYIRHDARLNLKSSPLLCVPTWRYVFIQLYIHWGERDLGPKYNSRIESQGINNGKLRFW